MMISIVTVCKLEDLGLVHFRDTIFLFLTKSRLYITVSDALNLISDLILFFYLRRSFKEFMMYFNILFGIHFQNAF